MDVNALIENGIYVALIVGNIPVLCLIGRTRLDHVFDLIPRNLLTFSIKDGKRRLVCFENFEKLIFDWSGGCDVEWELNTLTFAANVANYTICSTEPLTFWQLLH